MKNFLKIIIISTLLFQSTAFSKSDSTNESYFSIIGGDFVRATEDYAFIFNSLSRFDSGNLVNIVGIGAFTGTAAISEKTVRKYLFENQTSGGSSFFSNATKLGEPQYSIVLGGGIYLAGLFANSHEVRVTGRLVFESLLLAGVSTTVLKSLLGRSRPYMNQGNGEFKFFQQNDDFLSMPSGHTTVAFSVASVLASRIDRWWASVGLYGAATLCGISRMYLDRHWFTDVIIGAAIGTASGLAVCNAEGKNSKSVSRLNIFPVPFGLGICYRMN